MKSFKVLSLFGASVLVFAGCRGILAPGEKQARQDFTTVADKYRPRNRVVPLPELTPDSGLSNLVTYALLNSPTVEAAYFDWSASIENITVTRSRPDPQFTFQAYIENTLTSLMPGFAWNIPGPGKLKVREQVASAESEGKYFAFESAMLQTAFSLKIAYYQLGLLEEQLRLKRESLSLLDNSERILEAQSQTGQAALSDVLRVQSACARARSDLDNLEDSRRPLLENLKAALGMTPNQPNPPMPAHFETLGHLPGADGLLGLALTNNPQLRAMASDVRAAEAGIAMAYKERVPDFNAGLQAEVYRPPFYWPQASMTLPIWRDKLAAELAQAKANELAAKSRLSAAQVELVASFAEKSFAYREDSRKLSLVDDELIPKALQSVEIIRAGYRSGTMDFSNLMDAERLVLDLKLDAAEARMDCEIALADLSLMVAGIPPSTAPLLSSVSQP